MNWLKALPLFFTGIIIVAQADLRNATIEGTVRNLKTGEPLADVRITLVQELSAP